MRADGSARRAGSSGRGRAVPDLGPATPLIVVAIVLYLLFIVALYALTCVLKGQQPEVSLPADTTVELPDGTVVSADEATAFRRLQVEWRRAPAKVH